ncbi:unnamed protein product [Cyclocybe aegerita]|uniref:F-box domain-containing protein n=1 Tax=Cyclocybe aegerita TaxID=1973307 RepID=A0A8S0WMH1_CYCAE|nr:unnamed protein product [Cyclocybe aegerita]
MANNTFESAEEGMLQELSREKKKLEEKRDKLAQELEHVELNIIKTQAAYGAIYNKRSPLLNLPTEVTCLIFEYALLPSVEEEKDEEKGEEEPPEYLMEVTVSHVCRRWRAIALDFPSLWSVFCYEGAEAQRVPLDRFNAYMERSGTHLLELRLNFKGAGEDDDHEPLLQKAFLHVARWRRVTILSDQDTLLWTQLSKAENVAAPNLEYLAICPDVECECGNQGDLTEVEDLEPKLFGGGAPKLTSVWTDGTGPSACLPPLSNVTTLRIEENEASMAHKFSWTTFLDLLSLPALEDLSLVGETFLVPDFAFVEPVHMKSLKNLRFSDEGGMVNLLPLIRAPLLETLHIMNCWIEYSFSTYKLNSTYSFPSLRDLYFVESSADDEPARCFLNLTSSVKNVVLSGEDFEDCLLNTIITHVLETDTNVWPHLKNLTCNMQPPNEIEPYLAFAQSRPKKSRLVLRLDEDLVESWEEDDQLAEQLKTLKRVCKVKNLNRDEPLEGEGWPPGRETYSAIAIEDDDPFIIESYYASGDDE